MTRFLLALLALLAPHGVLGRDEPAPQRDDVHVLVLGLNDLHGQLAAGRKIRGRDAGSAGVLVAWLRDRMASHDGPSFVALAGDCVGASPASSALLQDEPTISLLNLVADETCSPRVSRTRAGECNVVATLGNHEFDEGWRELLRLWRGGRHPRGPFLEKRWRGARFPVACANVVRSDTGRSLVAPSVVLDADGVPIGFIGAVVSSTPSLVTPSGVEGLRFLDEAESVNAEAQRLLERGVRALVLVIHEGGRQDPYEGWTRPDAPEVTGRIPSIVRRLHPEVDLVVSGHTHLFTNARLPRDEGTPVLVTQAWSGGTSFAEIELRVAREDGDVTTSRARLVTALAGEGPGATPAEDAAGLAAAAQARVAPLVERVVTTTAAAITRKANAAGESALGNLVADAQRAATRADVALMNPGGLRADLPAGAVTWGDLFAVQPFGNVLVTMELTGEELRRVLEPVGPPGELRVLQGSGVTWTWDPEAPSGRRVRDVEVGGIPIEAFRTYRVTVNSFLASGGDDVTTLAGGRHPVGGPLDLDALEAHVAALPAPISAEIAGRITTVVSD